MKKLFAVIILTIFISSEVFAEKLTKYEVVLGNNGIIKNYNMFIKTKNDEYIKKAFIAKKEMFNILDKKKNSKEHQNAREMLLQIPVFLQYCVVSMFNNDKNMLTKGCYENFQRIEPDYGYAATSKEVVLENIVVYLGKYYEYDKAEKVALYTLKLYPNQAPTLFNLAMIYKESKSVREKAFKDDREFRCFSYQILFEADKIGSKIGFYTPKNFIRKNGFDKVKVNCKNFDFRKKLKKLIEERGF